MAQEPVELEFRGNNRGALAAARGTQQGLAGVRGEAKLAEREMGRLSRGAVAGSGAFRGLGRSVAFASGAFLGAAGLVEVLKGTIEAALSGEAATAKLDTAIRNMHGSVAALTPVVEGTEAANRKLGFTNDDVRASLTSLVTAFGATKQAFGEVKVAADLARFSHVDLGKATMDLIRLQGGNIRTAKQYGLVLADMSKKAWEAKAAHDGLSIAQEKGKVLYEALTARIKGQATAYAATARGAMAQFHAQLNNIQEIIGAKLLPIVTKYLTKIDAWLAKGANQARIQAAVNTAMRVLVQVVSAAKAAFDKIFPIVQSVVKALGGLKNVIIGIIALKFASVALGMAGSLIRVADKASIATGAVGGLRAALLAIPALISVAIVITEIRKNAGAINNAVIGAAGHIGLNLQPPPLTSLGQYNKLPGDLKSQIPSSMVKDLKAAKAITDHPFPFGGFKAPTARVPAAAVKGFQVGQSAYERQQAAAARDPYGPAAPSTVGGGGGGGGGSTKKAKAAKKPSLASATSIAAASAALDKDSAALEAVAGMKEAGGLARIIAGLNAQLGKVKTSKDLAAVRLQITGVGAAVKQVSGIKKKELAEQAKADRAAQTAEKAALRKHLADLNALVSSNRTAFTKAWTNLAQAATAAFDKQTSAGLRSIQDKYSAPTVSEAALAALTSGHDQAARDAQLQADRAAAAQANNDLAAAIASGDQSAIDSAKAAAVAAQAAVDNDLYDQQVLDLQAKASAERAAADKQSADDQQAYQDQRDAQKQALNDQLADLETALDSRYTTTASANAAIVELYRQFGIDISNLPPIQLPGGGTITNPNSTDVTSTSQLAGQLGSSIAAVSPDTYGALYPWLNPNLPHFGRGGIVPGGYVGRDSVPAMVSPGEGVFTPAQMRALGISVGAGGDTHVHLHSPSFYGTPGPQASQILARAIAPETRRIVSYRSPV